MSAGGTWRRDDVSWLIVGGEFEGWYVRDDHDRAAFMRESALHAYDNEQGVAEIIAALVWGADD